MPERASLAGYLPSRECRPLLLLCAVLLGGFGWLRVATGHYGFWFDEYATLIFADQPLSHLWGSWMVRETNPPLFYTLIKGWQAIGLQSVDQLRLLPILLGVVNLALLAVAAAIGWGRRAAVPALVLAGLSAQHLHISQLLRGYILGANGITIACIGLLLVLRHGPRASAWALYVGGSLLAIYSHTTLLLWPAIATLALPIAAGGNWRPALRGILLANCVIAVGAGWWLVITLAQLRSHNGNIAWIPPLSPRTYAWMVSQSVLLVREAIGGDHRLSKLVALATVLAVLAIIRQPATRLILGCAVLGILFQGVASLVQPIATQSTLFWLSLFVVLLLAGGIAALRSPGKSSLALIAVAGILTVNLARSIQPADPGDYVQALRAAQRVSGAAVLVEHASMGAVTAKACTIAFPGGPCPVPLLTVGSPLPTDSWAHGLGAAPLAPDQLAGALACCDRVFTLRSAYYDPAVRFGIVPAGERDKPGRGYVEGPFAATRFKAAAYRPPNPR